MGIAAVTRGQGSLWLKVTKSTSSQVISVLFLLERAKSDIKKVDVICKSKDVEGRWGLFLFFQTLSERRLTVSDLIISISENIFHTDNLLLSCTRVNWQLQIM